VQLCCATDPYQPHPYNEYCKGSRDNSGDCEVKNISGKPAFVFEAVTLPPTVIQREDSVAQIS
jgi:hypothetical protein